MARVYLDETGAQWGITRHQLCLKDGVAFLRVYNVSLPTYAGREDGSYAFYKITYRDPSGKEAVGWLGPADAAISYGPAVGVTGITKANPGVITFAPGHGFTGGELVKLSGLTEMTELNNGFVTLANKDGDTFEICDTSGYGAAETTGGNCAQQTLTIGVNGCRILSAVNGTERGWESIDSGFNYNAASYTFEVTRAFYKPMALYWVDADERSFLLGQSEDDGRLFGAWTNFDLPPADFHTFILPSYHGERYVSRKYAPRTITVPFTFVQQTLDGYWAERDAIIEAMGHKGQGYLKAIILFSDGSVRVRHLSCIPTGSLMLDGGMRYGMYGQQAVLQFIAHYPLWFDPIVQSASVSLNGSNPVTLNVTVGGNEDAFPWFKFNAEANNPQVQRSADPSDYIKIEKYITGAGNYVYVYTDIGEKRAEDQDGNRVQLSGDSTFWTLPGGETSALSFSATNGAGVVTVYWRNYYRGL